MGLNIFQIVLLRIFLSMLLVGFLLVLFLFLFNIFLTLFVSFSLSSSLCYKISEIDTEVTLINNQIRYTVALVSNASANLQSYRGTLYLERKFGCILIPLSKVILTIGGF